MEPIIEEFPPQTPAIFGDVPLNGGRVHSITVHPSNSRQMIVAAQFGGLWKTENGGGKWLRLDGLHTFRPSDVAYAPDGETVIATITRDNQVENGGGIWVSRNGGRSWAKPDTADPPANSRVPARMSAYGISYSPSDGERVYVGTDFGVATSEDNGATWRHQMLETVSAVATNLLQNAVYSILALKGGRVIALSSTGVYQSDDGGTRWSVIRSGDFSFRSPSPTRDGPPGINFKKIDASPRDEDKVFVLQDYTTLFLYEVASAAWTAIPLPGGGSRGPFVRVSRSSTAARAIDIWVGAGVQLLRATCNDITAARSLTATDWVALGRAEGLHDDSGYLALGNTKRPLLYGSDGGLFKPTDATATAWTAAASGATGFNSYQISDLAGTNVPAPSPPRYTTSLYFATQDNAIWASPDGGRTWPTNDCAEGFHVEAPRDAAADKDVTVAYARIGCGFSNSRFSDANLLNQRNVPDLDMNGRALTNMSQAFFLSQGNWIRFRMPPNADPEIYVSQDDGDSWRKRATIDLESRGVFTPAGPADRPTVYVPFRGTQDRSDGRERIGLLKLTGVFDTTAVTYDDDDLLYLPDEGSLGQRATEFDWQAVFGVDPADPDFIIAPDIYNQAVKVSRDGGRRWQTDTELTAQVTNDGRLLLYDDYAGRMQVTHIAFDPYQPRIFVGTRDAGVIVSEDRGATWERIQGSEVLLYVTGFFFLRHNIVVVSTYGRGLWTIDFRLRLDRFRPERYCRRPCIIRVPRGRDFVRDPIDWRTRDVTVFFGGRINGLDVAQDNTVRAITVTPGTTHSRFTAGKRAVPSLRITQSRKGRGFGGLAGALAAIDSGEVIKGVILEGATITGIISGDEESGGPPEIRAAGAGGPAGPARQPRRPGVSGGAGRPYLMVTTNLAMSGAPVVGADGVIYLQARGFRHDPRGGNEAVVMVDGVVRRRNAKVAEDGTVRLRLTVADDIAEGEHTIEVVQRGDGGDVRARGSFVKAMIDEVK